MCVEDRPRTVQFYQKRHQQQEWAEKHQADSAAHQIHPPFERQFPALKSHVAYRDQGQTAKIADRHLTGHDSERIRQHANADLFPLAQADNANQLLVCTFRQGNDHFVNSKLVNNPGNVGKAAQYRHIENGTRAAVIHDTDYLKAQFGIGLHPLQNHAPGIAAPNEQDPVPSDSSGLRIPLYLRMQCPPDRQHENVENPGIPQECSVVHKIPQE